MSRKWGGKAKRGGIERNEERERDFGQGVEGMRVRERREEDK